MPDSATSAVIRDFATLAFLAMLAGLVVYGLARLVLRWPAVSGRGRVRVSCFDPRDVWVAVCLLMFLLFSTGVFLVDASLAAPEEAGERAGNDLLTVATGIVFLLVLCGLLLVFLRVLRGLDPAEIFGMRVMSVGQAARMALGFIIPVYVGVLVIAGLVARFWLQDVWPDLNPQETVQAFKDSGSPSVRALMIVAAVVVAPIVEETIFRGYVYGVLKRFTDGWFAALCSSLLFAIVHAHIGSLVPLFLLALSFCAAYEFSGSLLVPMWMHAFFNATSMALITQLPDQLP